MDARETTSARDRFAGSAFDVLTGLDVEARYVSSSFAVTQWRCREARGTRGRAKVQPWHVVVFVHGGSFRIRSRRGDGVVDPAAILLLRPGEEYETAHVACCGDYGSAIALSEDAALSLAEASVQEGRADPWRAQVKPAEASLLARQFDLLRRLASRAASTALGGLGVEETLSHLAARALLPRGAESGRAAAGKPTRERVTAAQELLERRFSEPLRLDEIARAVEMSPFHLCRQFRRQTGWTIHRYLTHLRVAHGLERLTRNPRVRLLDLALDLGFDGHSHFSEVFRRLVGRSPSAFRAGAGPPLSAGC